MGLTRKSSFLCAFFFLSSCVFSNQLTVKTKSKPKERIVSFQQQRFHEETREVSPANLLIKIESFSLLRKNGIKSYEPRAFEAGGYKWILTIYPEGYESEKEDSHPHVSVSLSINETDTLPVGWEVNAIFTFFLFNHISNNYLCFRGPTRRFNAVIPKVVFSKLISKKRLKDSGKGFLVDDSFVFGAEVFVIKNQRINECLMIKDTHPYKREWNISNFFDMRHVWNSEEFVVGDYKWNVRLYPKGINQCGKRKYVSIFLDCVDSKTFTPRQKLKAEIRMSIKSKLDNNIQHYSRNFNQWFGSSSPACGDAEFISVDNMRSGGFVVDDSCFLEIEISVKALVLDSPKFN